MLRVYMESLAYHHFTTYRKPRYQSLIPDAVLPVIDRSVQAIAVTTYTQSSDQGVMRVFRVPMHVILAILNFKIG